MRIVGGEWGGRRLVAPKGRGTRPTLEMVREAIFDVLGTRVNGARVLDLFAGSGAMGFEALSRGARHVTWCDQEARAGEAIRENVNRLGLPPVRYAIIQAEALVALRRLARKGIAFDLVFVDPPYEAGIYDETLLEISLRDLMVPGGLVVVEHAKRIEVSPVFGRLVRQRERRYGESCVSYYRSEGSRKAVPPASGPEVASPDEEQP
jgi:16S rRNA (guanine(966)-N(2))-methyltransferase RsmD